MLGEFEMRALLAQKDAMEAEIESIADALGADNLGGRARRRTCSRKADATADSCTYLTCARAYVGGRTWVRRRAAGGSEKRGARAPPARARRVVETSRAR